MIRNIVPHIIFSIIFFLTCNNLYSENTNWLPAKKGNKIILIRHALAPGGGDPPGFDITNCETQRNLNQTGINQSLRIGQLFSNNNIPIDLVLSSEWCRCKDTAKYAFKKYEVFSDLNSTYQKPYDKKEKQQIKNLKKYIQNWNGKGGNLVLVTHYVIISALTNYAPSSGEIVIIDKDLKILSTINTF